MNHICRKEQEDTLTFLLEMSDFKSFCKPTNRFNPSLKFSRNDTYLAKKTKAYRYRYFFLETQQLLNLFKICISIPSQSAFVSKLLKKTKRYPQFFVEKEPFFKLFKIFTKSDFELFENQKKYNMPSMRKPKSLILKKLKERIRHVRNRIKRKF